MQLLVLLTLLAAAPADVRLEWAPVGAIDRSDGSDTHYYLIEHEAVEGWREIFKVAHSPNCDDYEGHRGVFVFDAPYAPGRWRLTTVDINGNASPPVYLQPVPGPGSVRPPACAWALPECLVDVRCERACSCDVVTRRLDEARDELRTAGVMEQPSALDHALCQSMIELVGPERLKGTDGVQAAGAAAIGSLLLATDMRAAAHELMHLYLLARGEQQGRDHERWEQDKRLRDIDRRHGVGRWTR